MKKFEEYAMNEKNPKWKNAIKRQEQLYSSAYTTELIRNEFDREEFTADLFISAALLCVRCASMGKQRKYTLYCEKNYGQLRIADRGISYKLCFILFARDCYGCVISPL